MEWQRVLHERLPGIARVRHRVPHVEIWFPSSPQPRGDSVPLLQQQPAQIQLSEWRSLSVDDVRGSGVAAETAPEHHIALRTGSMDCGPTHAAGGTSLRAPDRLFP